VVEPLVGFAAAEPAAHGKAVDAAVVMTEPAALAIERAVIEVTEHATRPR
jgi:hypothetical protein